MMEPGQTLRMLARKITKEIEQAIDQDMQDEFSPIAPYDIVEAHILKLLEHPMCPKCGCQKLRADCGHTWSVE